MIFIRSIIKWHLKTLSHLFKQ